MRYNYKRAYRKRKVYKGNERRREKITANKQILYSTQAFDVCECLYRFASYFSFSFFKVYFFGWLFTVRCNTFYFIKLTGRWKCVRSLYKSSGSFNEFSSNVILFNSIFSFDSTIICQAFWTKQNLCDFGFPCSVDGELWKIGFLDEKKKKEINKRRRSFSQKIIIQRNNCAYASFLRLRSMKIHRGKDGFSETFMLA